MIRNRSMSYLCFRVCDPVLYCGTNGSTHAPTVLSLASSTGLVLAFSLVSLRIVRVLVCFTEWCIHCAVSHTQQRVRCCSLQYAVRDDSLPLCFDLINFGEQFKSKCSNLLVLCGGPPDTSSRSCAKTNAGKSRRSDSVTSVKIYTTALWAVLVQSPAVQATQQCAARAWHQ